VISRPESEALAIHPSFAIGEDALPKHQCVGGKNGVPPAQLPFLARDTEAFVSPKRKPTTFDRLIPLWKSSEKILQESL